MFLCKVPFPEKEKCRPYHQHPRPQGNSTKASQGHMGVYFNREIPKLMGRLVYFPTTGVFAWEGSVVELCRIILILMSYLSRGGETLLLHALICSI